MRRRKRDVIAWFVVTAAAMFGHVFPVFGYTTTLTQQFTVQEEQPAGTVIGRVAGVRPPLRAYFRHVTRMHISLLISFMPHYVYLLFATSAEYSTSKNF